MDHLGPLRWRDRECGGGHTAIGDIGRGQVQLAAGGIALIYWIFPPERLSLRQILVATGSAAGAITVLSLLFTLYVGLGANFQEHYATSGLAAFVLLAVWLFLSNALVLVGYKIALETNRR